MVGADRIDPSWPPVLVFVVLAVVSAATLSFVVVFRKLRAEVRGARQQKGRTA
jgi:hypothetical protein